MNGVMELKYPTIRINRISLENMKSVKSGSIDFNAVDAISKYKSSMLGIYGQNGSGKTVVIESMAIIKAVLSGRPINPRYLENISFGENSGSIEVEFVVISENETNYYATYKCTLEQLNDPNENAVNNESSSTIEQVSMLVITNESLKVSGTINGVKYPKQNVIQSDITQKQFNPRHKIKLVYGENENNIKMLELHKFLAIYSSRSFIFSNQSIKAIADNKTTDFGSIVLALRLFAERRLFIVGGEMQKEIPLPINIVHRSDNEQVFGYIPFSLESKTVIPKKSIDIIASVIPSLNLVLSSMIPGLELSCKWEKMSLGEKEDEYEIELFASRNQGSIFPLRHESLGIRGVISILSLLIATYNDPAYVLIVDEFDSSIFEYLLGELVSVLKDSGKGQLIFTSHNLRPLEMLDDTSICFTTTNPENRYIKFKKKATNNLRSMYFRVLSLGCKEADLYNSKSKYALASAFREAGWDE